MKTHSQWSSEFGTDQIARVVFSSDYRLTLRTRKIALLHKGAASIYKLLVTQAISGKESRSHSGDGHRWPNTQRGQCSDTDMGSRSIRLGQISRGVSWRWLGVSPTYPIVSSLILIVNPVQAFISPILHTVLCHPLIYITASLGKDPRNHLDLLQIYL